MSRKDFHGGRSYSADPPDGGLPGFGLTLPLAFGWMKHHLGRLLGRDHAADGQSGLADVLAAQARDGRRKQARPSIFPMAEDMYRPKVNFWPTASQARADDR